MGSDGARERKLAVDDEDVDVHTCLLINKIPRTGGGGSPTTKPRLISIVCCDGLKYSPSVKVVAQLSAPASPANSDIIEMTYDLCYDVTTS